MSTGIVASHISLHCRIEITPPPQSPAPIGLTHPRRRHRRQPQHPPTAQLNRNPFRPRGHWRLHRHWYERRHRLGRVPPRQFFLPPVKRRLLHQMLGRTYARIDIPLAECPRTTRRHIASRFLIRAAPRHKHLRWSIATGSVHAEIEDGVPSNGQSLFGGIDSVVRLKRSLHQSRQCCRELVCRIRSARATFEAGRESMSGSGILSIAILMLLWLGLGVLPKPLLAESLAIQLLRRNSTSWSAPQKWCHLI